MSDEEQQLENSSDGELLTAEFKDGKLEIVEVSSYTRGDKIEPEVNSDGEELKYLQVLDTKNTMVDLLNFTLVRSDDGEQSFRLVSSSEDHGEADTTVTCVITGGDGDDQDNQEYVMVEGIESGSDGSVVLLQQAPEPKTISIIDKKPETKACMRTPTSPTEILERAKALQKAKILMRAQNANLRPHPPPARYSRGAKRKSELPPPHELLASPNFKLFLYSCKMCRFKCNAIKELTAHKALEHATGSGGAGGAGARWRGAGRAAAGSLQCARCPFRASAHSQLMKHVQENHVDTMKVYLDSAEVEAADVLVCGACGYESASRALFRKHIEEEHGAAAC